MPFHGVRLSVALLLEWLMNLSQIKIKSSYMMSDCFLYFIKLALSKLT